MGPSVVWVLLLAGFLLSAGCIGPLQQWGEETTFRPKATSFDPATLKHEQVAVLNAVVGFGLEGFAHQVSRSLSSALDQRPTLILSLIHISEPTRLLSISYAVFCLKKKNTPPTYSR